MGSGNKLTLLCTDFRPLHRNTLRGFARVKIAELKLEIGDIAIHEKGAARWAQPFEVTNLQWRAGPR
jgi:hypothetical protein